MPKNYPKGHNWYRRKDGTVRPTLILPEDLYLKAKAQASLEDRSFTSLARVAITQYLEKERRNG